MADKNYSKREIDEKLANFKTVSDDNRAAIIETITRNDKDTRESLTRIELKSASIEEQTKKTNGRVSSLENWKGYVIGFCACFSIVVLPALFIIAKAVFHI